MSIPSVMFEAVKAFEPTEENGTNAFRAALAAGKKYCIDAGTSVDLEKLRDAALEVWHLYVRVRHSKLLLKEIRGMLPPSLYAQEHERDPMVYVKFFTPNRGWTWFATEFDGLNTFFGYVVGLDSEFGYFLLSELEDYTDPLTVGIERDEGFTPKRLSEVRKEYKQQGGL